MAEKELRINEGIRVREVRLLDENGEQKGVVSIQEALTLAQERGYDLVEVAPQANPPVCKLLDYGKYVFDQEKKLKESKKKQKQIEERASEITQIEMKEARMLRMFRRASIHWVRFMALPSPLTRKARRRRPDAG